MENGNIYQTPESDVRVESSEEFVYAGFWIRTSASIIDTIIIMVATYPILTMIYGRQYWVSDNMIYGIWDVIISYILPPIAVIVFWIYKSATPGKMLLGLKVISLGESPKLTIGQSIGRYFAYIPSFLIFCLGVIWVAFDERKQGWHDKLANTTVVRKGKA